MTEPMRFSFVLSLLLLSACSREGEWGDPREGNQENPLCPDRPYLMCDDFEGETWEEYWIPNIATGAITRDEAQAWQGDSSLRFSVDAVQGDSFGQAFLAQADTLAQGLDRVFVRMHAYIPDFSNVDFSLMSFGQATEPYRTIQLAAGADGHLKLVSSVIDMTSVDLATDIPVATWFCLEWQVDFQAPQQVRIWLDGTELTSFNRLVPTQPDPPMQFYNVGPMIYYAGFTTEAYSVWVDDVILNDARIGCE